MTSAMLNARLKFLDASAHHYSTLAPATSAHLMLERVAVAAGNENTPLKPVTSNTACAACGTIRIPGWTSRTTIVDPTKPRNVSSKFKKHRRTNRRANTSAEKQVVVECRACRRKSVTPLQASQRPRINRKRSSNTEATFGARSAEPVSLSAKSVANSAQASETPMSANNSSKKRAKTRKQGGLQAMLEKSKGVEGSSGFGLNLMDLMKQV